MSSSQKQINNKQNNTSNIIPYSINFLFKKYVKGEKQETKYRHKTAFSLDSIIEILSKEKHLRNLTDVKSVSKFLVDKYEYFQKINSQGEKSKLEKIVFALNLEKYEPNQYIIKYDQEGDKFYIVLKGKVKVSKPTYFQKKMTVREYLDLIYDIKNNENDYLKYKRINDKNSSLNLNIEYLLNVESDPLFDQKYNFLIEKEEDLGIFFDGFPFGEIALIKRCKRNAFVKALKDTYCISLTKHDYHKIMIELEQKRLERTLQAFQKTYPLFQFWNLNDLIKLFNCLSTVKISKGEFLFKQNENCEYIYFIKSGVYEVYSMISLNWVKDFFNYIISSKNNLLHILMEQDERLKEPELRKLYDKLLINCEKSPCNYDPFINNKIMTNYESSNTILIDNKEEEEKMLNKYRLFKVSLKIIDNKDIIGIEDALELKKRFNYVKCISPQGELLKISLFDFFKLLNTLNDDVNRKLINELISEKKRVFFRQIVQTAKNKGKRFDTKIDYQYNMFLMDQDKEMKKIAKKITGNNYQNIEDIPRNVENEILKYLKNPNKKNEYLLNEDNDNKKLSIQANAKLNNEINNFIKFHKHPLTNNYLKQHKLKYFHRRNFSSLKKFLGKSNEYSTFNQYKSLSKNLNSPLKYSQKTIIIQTNNNTNSFLTGRNKTSKKLFLNKSLSPNNVKQKREFNNFILKSPENSNDFSSDFYKNIFSPKVKSISYRYKMFEQNLKITSTKKIKSKKINKTTLSDSSEEKITSKSNLRYSNFSSILNGKKIYLKKNFRNVLEKEAKRDKPQYPLNFQNK